jgi:erythromycin esterase
MWKSASALLLIAIGLLYACDKTYENRSEGSLGDLDPVEVDLSVTNLNRAASAVLAEIVDGAQIVAIGESRHDTKEQFLLKTALVKTLVSELGYKTIVFEESFSHALKLDAFVTTGEGDIRSILSGLAGWYLWDTEEMVDLIMWVRRYNSMVPLDQMVRVLGMDITAPSAGIRSAIAAAKELDSERDWPSLDYGLELLAGDFWPETMRRYQAISEARKDAMGENLRNLRGAFDNSNGESIQSLQAEIAVWGHKLFTSSSIEEGGLVREQGMARVVDWIVSNIAQESGTIIWTHNLHAAKVDFRMPSMGEAEFRPMGVLLSGRYGESFRSVAGTFGHVSFFSDSPRGERIFVEQDPTSVDGAMMRMSKPTMLIDLRSIEPSSDTGRWLAVRRRWRMQDAIAILTVKPGFDGIYFVDSVSNATPTPNAIERANRAECHDCKVE